MDVGTTLRNARERQDLLITDLAVATKIPVRLLLALEDNEFHTVPSGIFVRGYLRAYAREVDLDPDALIEQYLAETGDVKPPVAVPPTEMDTADDENDLGEPHIDPNLTTSGTGWGYTLIVAALLVAIISFNRGASNEEAPGATASLVETAAAVEVAEPVAVAVSDEIRAIATAGEGLRFEFEAQGPCWVEAIVDGRQVVYRLMQPGERESVEPQRDIVLRVGDPAAFAYTVNGEPGAPFGKPGVPATVRFTTDGDRIQLAS